MTASAAQCHGSPDRVPCTYCLGAFVPSRKDAETCSDDCRQRRHRALKLKSHADVRLASDRPLGSDEHGLDYFSEERHAATGRGRLTRQEARAADFRVRVLAGRDVVETRVQWEAVDAMPDGPERLGFDRSWWTALGRRLEQERQDLAAWLARNSD